MAALRALLPSEEPSPEAMRIDSPENATTDSERPKRGPVLGKRNRNIVQACALCHRNKTKCDGQRPACGGCQKKSKECVYPGDDGQSRVGAMKTRLAALEDLFSKLRDADQDDAQELLKQIQSTKGVVMTDDITKIADHPASEAGSPTKATSLPRASSVSRSATSTARGSICSMQTDSTLVALDTPSMSQKPPGQGLWWHPLSLPTIDSHEAEKAISAFYSCSGKIFHVFTGDQVAELLQRASQRQGDILNPAYKADLCCLAAIAAVGMQYIASDHSAVQEEALYEIARRYFETLLELRPLDAIKVCVIMAMSNILAKATVAFAYVEIGLSLSKAHRLHEKYHRASGISLGDWASYRKTWRTLMFLASWLSATLGYVSNNDMLAQGLPLSDVELDVPQELTEVVQRELTKIAMLKANILRMHLAFKDLTMLSIDSIVQDLKSWRSELPEELQLGYIHHAHIADEARRSIYHIHLLYLGAIMLLYRRIASQFIRDFGRHSQNGLPLPSIFDNMAFQHANLGVVAAKQSAEVLSILLAEDGIFQRCWLIIFQAYTACTIILQAIAQKQLHRFPREQWAEDAHHAKQCLEVLAYCGTSDPVALSFLEKLRVIFEKLMEAGSAAEYTPVEISAEQSQRYILTIPSGNDSDDGQISLALLIMLCRPYGDPAHRDELQANMAHRWRTDPSRYEYPQLVERLDWDYESRVPYHWEMEKLVLQDGVNIKRNLIELNRKDGRFLGNTLPSGWSALPSLAHLPN